MRQRWIRLLGLALVATVLGVAGCGRMSTAPAVSPGGGSEASSGPDRAAPREIQVAGGTEPIRNPSSLDEGSRVVKTVQGSIGDTLRVDGVMVTVPPDAFQGTAQITLSVPDPARSECHIEIDPPSLNHFQVPVRLEFDIRGAEDPRVMLVYWYDESATCWVPLTTTFDAETGAISTDLAHFSIYKADSEVQTRAGW